MSESRIENILDCCVEGCTPDEVPKSRIEVLLCKLSHKIAALKVHKVKVAGVELVPDEDGAVDVPVATTTVVGVVKFSPALGATCVDGVFYSQKATAAEINGRTQNYKPIVPSNLDAAVKAALCDGAGAEWTEEEKAAARARLGIT